MGKGTNYLTAPLTAADVVNAIELAATDPSVGWEKISDGGQRPYFTGFNSKADAGGANFAAYDPVTQTAYVSDGSSIRSFKIQNGEPTASSVALSGLPSGAWMLAVVGNHLYAVKHSATTDAVYVIPINPGGTLGTPVAATTQPPAALTPIAVAAGYLFGLGANGNVYRAEIGAGGDITGWTLAASATSADLGVTLNYGRAYLVGNSKRLYLFQGNGNQVWSASVDPGTGALGAWEREPNTPAPQDHLYALSWPIVATDTFIFAPYLDYGNAITVIADLDIQGRISWQSLGYYSPPGGNAGASPAVIAGDYYVIKYGSTYYYTQITNAAPGVVLRANNGLGRDKYLFVRVTGSLGVESYIAEDWDPTTDAATNIVPILTQNLDPTLDASMVLLGQLTHLAFFFRQGNTITPPAVVCEIDPYLRPDGTPVYPADDGSWPLWGGISSFVAAYQGMSGLRFTTPRGPLGRDWIVLGDWPHMGSAPAFAPQPPSSFGGGTSDFPHMAKRGRVYQRTHNNTPRDSDRALERGYLGAGDTILFVANTQGAVEDVVETPSARYTIVYRRRDNYGYYDLLVKEDDLAVAVM